MERGSPYINVQSFEEQEMNVNAVVVVTWESKSTRLRPFAQDIPLPLFPSKYPDLQALYI